MDKCGRAGQATDDNIIRRMRIARWVINAKGTRSEYVILIDFQRQHWLRERTSMLRVRTLPVLFTIILTTKRNVSQHPPTARQILC